MARFSGKIGYVFSEETSPGVYTDKVVERTLYGDVTRNVRRWENGSDINDDVAINNTISVVADSYAFNHTYAMKYVKWMGAAWKINSIDIQRPRLILTIGGVYNGEQN